MPEGTKVHGLYSKLLAKYGDKGKAARISQSVVGRSLASNKPLKRKKKGAKA